MAVLVFLPAAVGLLDVLENTLLMAAINQFSDVSHPVVRVASWATQGKLVLGFTTMTIVVIGILAWAVTTLRARTPQELTDGRYARPAHSQHPTPHPRP